MTDRPRFGREYIREEFERISRELQTGVVVFLVGGGAMSFRDLKDTTKDIDFVATTDEDYERLLATLGELGYEEMTNLDDAYEQLGARQCVKNDDGCQIDLFNRQIANKLLFSDGMRERSEELFSQSGFRVRLASLEDLFLFKSVAERPDDIDDMATLIQTGLDFDTIEDEIETQVTLLGSEYFTTVVSASLQELDERHGIQTPLDEPIREYYRRYMQGYELLNELDEETPRSIDELAESTGLDRSEIELRFEYLEQFDAAKRVPDGLLNTGRSARFERS